MKRTQRHGLSTEQCLLYHSSEGEQTKEVLVLQRRGQVVSGGEGYLACSRCGGNFTTSFVKLQLLSMFSAEENRNAERARRKGSLVQMWCLDVCTFAQELSCTPRYRSMHTAKVNMIQLKNWWMRNRQFFARQSTNKLATINFASQADFLFGHDIADTSLLLLYD